MNKAAVGFVTFLLTLFLSVASSAQALYQAGVHYQVLPTPVSTQTGDKVEIAEVFWYGCGHCYNFEPLLVQFEKQLPEGAEFVKSPAMWNEAMKVHAKVFYTAEVLGVLKELHPRIFTAMHTERRRLTDADDIYAVFATAGVSRADFDKAFQSFTVATKVKQADARARNYKITGTPEIVVNGKYRISARMTGSQSEMLKVVDFLVKQELANK